MLFAPYYNRLARHAEALFDQAKVDPAEDIIHDLRVGIRRWRQAKRLANDCRLPPIHEESSAVPVLFRQAALLRDAQVNLQLATLIAGKEDALEKSFQTALEKNLSTQRRLFLEKLDPMSIHLGRIHRRVLTSTVRARLRKRLAMAIRDLLKSNMHPHALRLCIKRAKYLVEIWQKCFVDSREVESLRRELAAAQDLIGDWHDLTVLSEVVRRFYRNRLRTGGALVLTTGIQRQLDVKQLLIPAAVDQLRTCVLNFGEQNATIKATFQRKKPDV